MASSIKSLLKTTQKQYFRLKHAIQKLSEDRENEELKMVAPPPPKEKTDQDVLVRLSNETIVRTTIIVLLLLAFGEFIGEIGDILLVFFVSVLFAAALAPTVNALQKRKIPRSLSVLAMFLALLGLIVLFISQLIPLVVTELIELAKNLNTMFAGLDADSVPFAGPFQPIIDNLLNTIDRELIVEELKIYLDQFANQLSGIAGDTFNTLIKVFNGIFNFILVLILTYFLAVDDEGVNRFFLSLFPSKHGTYIVSKTDAIKDRVGFWLRGQVILMIVMFFLTLIVFFTLGLKYALTLAMLAGIAEIIPVFGPLIAGVPALLVAFNQSTWLALWVLIAILILQQIENNILVPMVMKKAVGLSPIIIILAMLIGFSQFNVLGAIIAIPVATTLSIFVHDYAMKKK